MSVRFLFGAAGIIFSLLPQVSAQVNPHARTLLAQSIIENQTITLRGNTRPEANPANDRGAVADDFRTDHLLLQLKRPAEQQQALERLLHELQDSASPNYHQWLTPQQFGQQFGLALEDLQAITGWLESHGFTVNEIYPNLAIDFSGTAAQVRKAFHTQIHHLLANGKHHYANMGDPRVPAALEPLVIGVASLNDFMPHAFSHAVPDYTTSTGSHLLVPEDIATIYNLNPAFAAGLSGQGRTIAVLENSNLYSVGDWLLFRKVFGLARRYPQGKLTTIHPQSSGGPNCIDPMLRGDEVESTLDAEWATAAAPNATIEVASCADTFTFGGFVALQNLLAGASAPPEIVSISFGMSESDLGAANNAYISGLYQMAVAEGVSIFVSSGDSGAAFINGTATFATGPIAVNGYASTPFNVSVGGTDFADTYFGTAADSWSAANSPSYGSALRYIPEIPWNDSCASQLLATSKGFSTTYGAAGYCNNGGPATTIAASGGPSGCATGSPFGSGSEACAGYSKPSWQSIFGNPSDGVRDTPDVSLFASNGAWGHYYVVCFSDVGQGGKSCLGVPSTWNGFGGTSISAPIMAGIQALVNQATGNRWGNPDPLYYNLASAEYGGSGNASCNSTNSSPGSTCAFHDITLGDIDVNCRGNSNCFFGPSPGLYGVLSTTNASYQPAYPATVGWDFATGIGSVDAWNLISRWSSPASSFPAPLTFEDAR